MNATILVADDEPLILTLISSAFDQTGFKVLCSTCGQEAISIFEKEPVDLAILDYSLPDLCGAELFHQLRAGNPSLPVVFLTGYPNVKSAVDLMKSGARDYLTKPFSPIELVARVRAILEGGPGANRQSPETPPARAGRAPAPYLYGHSEAMRIVEAHVLNLPRYPDTTVLITGPTGTGKSAVARRIHELTWDKSAPFVEIDCSTIPRELCESELFGHEKGAFTGAHRTKQGLFEAAGHGTAFLDEIGELDLPLQAKLLRVLEARQFKRVGGHATLPMAARIIAATNRSLPELVHTGRFREDLYFRLNVFELWMPPLKDRGEDVIMLARHYLEYFAGHHKKRITGYDADALNFIRNCDFPGNIRELRNMIERAVINADTPLIHFAQLVALNRGQSKIPVPQSSPEPEIPPAIPAGPPPPPAVDSAASLNLALLERQKLLEALSAASGNKSKASKLVGLSRTAFHRRLQKYDVPN